MNDFGLWWTKDGVSLENARLQDYSINTDFDTPTIYRSGELVIELPEETLLHEESSIYTADFQHGLGYVPIASPTLTGYPYLWMDPITMVEHWDEEYLVNDLEELQFSIYGGGFTPHGQFHNVVVNDQKLFLTITRIVFDPFDSGGVEFQAQTAKLYYTILYNRIDEEQIIVDVTNYDPKIKLTNN